MTEPRPRLFLLLDRAAHAVRQRLDRQAQDALGIGTVQLGALFHLVGHEGCLQKELASALGIQPAAVTGLVDRMETAGLVQRRAHATDARAQRLHATAAGKRVAAKARPVVATLQDALLAGFDAAEIAVITRFLTAAAQRDLRPPAEGLPP